ncbi:hypothetical protein BVZ28_07280 [Alcaligenes faecalis]|uniref:O-antigen ligase family protein n=2 Tax=Alcaligenes faecalis TaxID=511 RepID=UPI000A2D0FED|nr:O-antigen ligase family protein [Alcaligenes faecalis]OSZ35385.1 hypothetical protein BVZ28_07280 [Alcaligenes faecalis]OSZ44470.1 hypothetical protein BVZ30_07205 [Alcaligenes faecalis]OSZ45172.1 hypothetical protein BVZ29_05160 [Alcaligenes faecalis]
MGFFDFLSKQKNNIFSILVFCFYFTLLATKDAYSFFAILIVLFSLFSIRGFRCCFLSGKEKSILILFLLFSIMSIVATIVHGSYIRSFEVPVKFAFGVLVMACMLRYPPKPAAFLGGLATGAIGGLVVAWLKMMETGEFKAFGYTGAIQFGNLALTISVLLIVAVCWLSVNKVSHRRFWLSFLSFGAVCGLAGSYYSGTRGGWVAIPLFVLLFILAYVRRSNMMISIASIFFFSGLVVGGVYQSPLIMERIKQAHQDITEYQVNGAASSSSLGARFAIWGATWTMLEKQPLLGVGEIQFRNGLDQQEQAGLLGEVPAGLANTHNTFLEVWVWYGGIALLLLVAAMASASWYFLTYIRHTDAMLRGYALAGLCLVGGYFVYSQTQIMLIRNNTLLFFLVTLSCLLSLMKQRKE